jgi:tetratricopeptide (TPR) repeat protein
MIGQTISHYQIVSQLGAGGMGVVYKARDLRLPRNVALKFLPPYLSADENAKKRFIHEAEATSALDHPHICAIHEIDETDDGQVFIVMPCYEGQTLQQKMEGGPVPVDEALEIVRQVGSGLSKAHSKGILHRDIKPANVFMTEDGHAKILDFGLAKLAGQTKVTKSGSTVGTISYMSPEQARGGELDARSDVYSLGALSYEMLAGKPPFQGDHEAAVMYSIMNMDPEPLSESRDDLPAGVQAVVDRALAKDRDDRYETADDLVADLERAVRGDVVAPPRRRPRIRIRRRWVIAAAVVVAAFIAGYVIQSRLPGDGVVSDATVSPDLVAVFPFSYRGGAELAYLEDGIVDLLGDRFDGAGGLRATGARAGDPSEYARAAAEAGAGLYVNGNILEAGGNLNVSGSLFETAGDGEPSHEATSEGPTDEVLRVLDNVAADLLAEYFSRPNERTTRVACETAGSFEVFKSYLTGERLYRMGHLTEAVEAFQNAVDQDTTFAVGYFRLAWAASYTPREFTRHRQALQRALRNASALPERERLLVEGAHARYIENDLDKAERLYGNVVSRFPNDVEGNLALGEMQGAGGGARHVLEEAKASLGRVLTSVPDHYAAITELLMIAMEEGDLPGREKWTRRRLEVSPDGEYAKYDKVELAYGVGDESARADLMDNLQFESDQMLIWCVQEIGGAYGNLEDGAAIGQLLTEPTRPATARAAGSILLAHIDVAWGRWKDARERLIKARPWNAAEVIEQGAMLHLVPLMPVGRHEFEQMRDEIDSVNQYYEDPSPWADVLRAYLSGSLSVRLADVVRAERSATEMESLEDEMATVYSSRQPWLTMYATDLTHHLHAEIALMRTDTTGAITEFAKTSPDAYQVTRPEWSLTRSGVRSDYTHALLAESSGNIDAAIEIYESIEGTLFPKIAYLPAKHLKLGELYESVGNVERAKDHYRRFVELWQNCDEELKPLVADVEARIARLDTQAR